MFRTAFTLAALATAVCFASSPTLAESGRQGTGGGTAKVSAPAPVNKPASTPKNDKSSSDLMKHTATGKHYQKPQLQ
jgi:hypothetical protein